MKKRICLSFLCLSLAISQVVCAQSYQKGDKLLNVGIGLGTYGAGGLGFGGSFEVGIHPAISVGVLGGYSGRSNYLGSGVRWSVLTIGARGSYHLGELLKLNDDKIDLYAGLGLGYRNISWNYGGTAFDNNYGSGILLLAHLGGRYYFANNMSAYAELGSGFGTLQAGISFKF
ncbi:MAG: hypothetical protein EAZ32_15045 [Cytophagia bacterium]|nr:MAG: hypothetical protein EAZ46_09380 [Runella sp.]TAG25096.1 MAG: hypothetical protein EAZ38_00350 [Cytophagales bacterium]TAG37517.1 MAG: hypothetical protein EAZ32_15045 [Cytophagia bacterium]TAG55236.1 MAG: hypothetical protein EAZ29_03920 [Runella slithyformis]TAG84553.1 MAG: hypothetical protein EAZ22_00520 [Cytophagales bacterium]